MVVLVGSVIRICSSAGVHQVGILQNRLMNGVRHHGVQVNQARVIHTAANLESLDHTVANQARVDGPQAVRVSEVFAI